MESFNETPQPEKDDQKSTRRGFLGKIGAGAAALGAVGGASLVAKNVIETISSPEAIAERSMRLKEYNAKMYEQAAEMEQYLNQITSALRFLEGLDDRDIENINSSQKLLGNEGTRKQVLEILMSTSSYTKLSSDLKANFSENQYTEIITNPKSNWSFTMVRASMEDLQATHDLIHHRLHNGMYAPYSREGIARSKERKAAENNVKQEEIRELERKAAELQQRIESLKKE